MTDTKPGLFSKYHVERLDGKPVGEDVKPLIRPTVKSDTTELDKALARGSLSPSPMYTNEQLATIEATPPAVVDAGETGEKMISRYSREDYSEREIEEMEREDAGETGEDDVFDFTITGTLEDDRKEMQANNSFKGVLYRLAYMEARDDINREEVAALRREMGEKYPLPERTLSDHLDDLYSNSHQHERYRLRHEKVMAALRRDVDEDRRHIDELYNRYDGMLYDYDPRLEALESRDRPEPGGMTITPDMCHAFWHAFNRSPITLDDKDVSYRIFLGLEAALAAREAGQ